MLPDFANAIAFLRSHAVNAHFTMGGHFPTIAPQRTLQIIPGLDTVVRHEGEKTLLDLVRQVDQPAKWTKLAGIAFRRRGRVVVNMPRPLITDLDTLPTPTRRKRMLRIRGIGIASLIASRGCYYNCSFCSIRTFYKGAPGPLRRTRSPVNVVDEMEALYLHHGVRVFIFKDDDLATRSPRARDWIIDFGRELRARRLHDTIVWRISCRVDDLNPELLRLLKRVGLTWVYLGIESGSDQGLRTFNKHFSISDIWRGVESLNRLGLAFDYGFMLLDPDSTFASVKENIDFLDRLGQRGNVSVHFTKMYPYVGTPLAARLAGEGRLIEADSQPDYPFLDPRLDLFQVFLAEAFHERNFGPSGLVSVSRMAAFDVEILKRFHAESPVVQEYSQTIRRIIADGNAVAVSAMRKALAVLDNRPAEYCLAIVPYLRDLARIARDTDQQLSKELSGIMKSNGYRTPY
jgi:radical SAM superfamily enzyme YgiQ (UPF0313 family)